MSNDIFFWTRHDEHGYCSNFARTPITINLETWPTVEHYYQAMKTDLIHERRTVMNCKTPTEAKFAGYHVKLRPDWSIVRLKVMLTGLRAKFHQYPDLRDKLLSTGEARLHENSPWDKFWGYAKGEGEDMLGKLLVQVREELRNE